jgi:hypothetical protein
MPQMNFDFNTNVNQREYSLEENLIINDLINSYKKKRQFLSDEEIITKLFFEVYSVEIINSLKSSNYFEGNWSFIEAGIPIDFHNFINDNESLDDRLMKKFIFLMLVVHEYDVIHLWKDNNTHILTFDRRVTEILITLIAEGKIDSALLLYQFYLKMWNTFSIYKKPFNNPKAILIHRLFAQALWPRNKISHTVYAKFESGVSKLIQSIDCKEIYFPFFDQENRDYYSLPYLKERKVFEKNIENLFDYDNTDETEPYYSLIESLLAVQSDSVLHIKKLISKKVDKLMYPGVKDIEMIIKLYESNIEKEFGKWLLSRFYLFNNLSYH